MVTENTQKIAKNQKKNGQTQKTTLHGSSFRAFLLGEENVTESWYIDTSHIQHDFQLSSFQTIVIFWSFKTIYSRI